MEELEAFCSTAIGVKEWIERSEYMGDYGAWFSWVGAKARIALQKKNFGDAKEWSSRLWDGANVQNNRGNLIYATLMQGEVFREIGDLDQALKFTNMALADARRTEHEGHELAALIQRAELEVKIGDVDSADYYLSDTWLRLTEGPLPQLLSRAYLIKAKIEASRDQRMQACEAAIEAVKHAWCDGPPFTFHGELEAARKMCEKLGVSVPQLPPFQGNCQLPAIKWKELEPILGYRP